MKNLLDCIGQAVELDVYSESDRQYKHKLTSTTANCKTSHVPTAMLAHVKIRRLPFKINCDPETPSSDVSTAFNNTIDFLNFALSHLSSPAFVRSLDSQVKLTCDNINIRDENGYSIGSHLYKNILKTTVESVLAVDNTKVTLNIGNGTLYINEHVVINSGLTSVTSLSKGLVNFINFVPAPSHSREYNMLSAKLSGSFPKGSWLNMFGDTLLATAYKKMVFSSLLNCLQRLKEYLPENPDIVFSIDPFIKSASDSVNQLQEQTNDMLLRKAVPTGMFENHHCVMKSDDYKQLVELDLGQESIDTFYEKEANLLILNDIATRIGAKSVRIIDFFADAKYEERTGYFDEFYCSHVKLPHKKVRGALKAIQNLLKQQDPLFCACFDESRLHINVAGSSDYDHHTEETLSEYEYLDINLGIASPLVNEDESVRFVFDVLGR
jgi:hypothetical protein